VKKPNGPTTANDAAPNSRRQLLKAATAGAALSLLPGAHVIAAGKAVFVGPTLAMGYWKGSMQNVKSAAEALVDALTVAPAASNYLLRVNYVSTTSPISLVAQYPGGAEHFFWQAWSEAGMLQRSSPIAIRWSAGKGNALPLVVRIGSGLATTQVPARAGTYALAVGQNGQSLPSWNSLALRGVASNGGKTRLVSRTGGAEVAFPYAVFSVASIG
jgi:hypothetical protein